MLSPIIIVLGLKTRFMINLQLMYIYSVMYGSKFVCFFSTWISKCSNTTCWKTILLHSIAFASLSKRNCLCKCGFISGLVVYSTDQCFYLYANSMLYLALLYFLQLCSLRLQILFYFNDFSLLLLFFVSLHSLIFTISFLLLTFYLTF